MFHNLMCATLIDVKVPSTKSLLRTLTQIEKLRLFQKLRVHSAFASVLIGCFLCISQMMYRISFLPLAAVQL